MITIDLSNAVKEEELLSYQEKVNSIHQALKKRTSRGSDFLGWLSWPVDYDKEEFSRVKSVAQK